MTTEKREPFEMHDTSWYDKPLDYKVVIYETNHETHVAKITLNRPEKMNALSHQLRAELFHALKVAEKDNDINVIILKGAGRCFSAGYDLGGGNVGVNEPDFGSQYVGVSHWPRYLVNQYWQIWELSKVVIAQTHGYCLAGGLHLMTLCDLLVTTPDCQFGKPPVRAQGLDIMNFPWLWPRRKAAELMYTGDSISGEESYRLGMANYCVPKEDIDEFTETFANRVALNSWQVLTLYKRGFNKTYEIMGIRTAMETSALFVIHMAHETDHFKEMGELFRKVPLREYLTVRDGPYKDYRAKEQVILDRAKREGEEWKGVPEEHRPKS